MTTHHGILWHVIFSTKYRKRYLAESWRDELFAYISGIVTDHKAVLLKGGGIEDHIHLLLRVHPEFAISKTVQMLKANSSRWINQQGKLIGKFQWQRGYAAFSVSQSLSPSVKHYIDNQREHHRRLSYQEELVLGLPSQATACRRFATHSELGLSLPWATMLVAVMLGMTVTVASGAERWRESLTESTTNHCADCHSGSEPSGGLDLDLLIDRTSTQGLEDPDLMRLWTLVHDRVRSGEMPPADYATLEPAERAGILQPLSAALIEADRDRRAVVMRRLNRHEYQNTVSELFGVQVDVRELLPRDNSADGFDNVGEALAFSPEAATAYLDAADAVLDAVWGPAEPPQRIEHRTNLLQQEKHNGTPVLLDKVGSMFRQTDAGLVIFQSGYCPTHLYNFARLRAPVGTYRGRVKVRAIQSDAPVTLRIYGGDTIVGRREEHVVGYYDIPPGEWSTIEFEDRLVEPGGTFQFKCYGTRDTRKDADTYPEPGLEIGDIMIEGPLEPWPPPSRERLFGRMQEADANGGQAIDPETAGLAEIRQVLRRLLPRAFRLPAEGKRVAGADGSESADGLTAAFEPELEALSTLAEEVLEEGESFEEALRVALKGMLCSPRFLYLEEPVDDAAADRIAQHALANRLSYFLWSSMPDAELMRLAAEQRLRDPEQLRRQVERMLDDPRSSEFTRNFVGQWLDLRDIDFTMPDGRLYPEFDELLQMSMLEESELFFEEVLRHDLSLLNFVDSEFSFLNQRLAEHYGIGGVKGQRMRRVELPGDSPRGGVLTQASVLKVTANGTNTSPVMRGVWVLENIMGEEVPPPPANVSAVEPDIRGATTLREQLAKHRSEDSCYACHRQIDPAGFALENFDPIGGWRTRYRNLGDGERPEISRAPHTHAWVRYRIGQPVDASGMTHAGETFYDIHDFKRILASEPKRIAEGITRKLTTYALGRRLGFSDRQAIDEIVESIADSQPHWGFRTLVHEIVQHEVFHRP